METDGGCEGFASEKLLRGWEGRERRKENVEKI